MKRSFKKVTRIASGVVVSLATILLFQNCTGNGFASDGSDVLMEQDSSAHFASSSGDVKVGADEDIITPRLVFSSTPTGSAQKIFRPGQTIYARAYGLSPNKRNLTINVTEYQTMSCLYGGGACKKFEPASLSYNPANKTWNFQLKFAFDIARKVIVRDSTINPLTMRGDLCAISGGTAQSSWCTDYGMVQNTVVVQSSKPTILAVSEINRNPTSETYGEVFTTLDFNNSYTSASRRTFIMTNVPPVSDVVYCSEVVGSNACADKSKWARVRASYVMESQTVNIENTAIENYYCGNNRITDPFNKDVKFYAEDLKSGVSAQATFSYGSPIEGCQPSYVAPPSNPSQGGFGP